MNSHLLLGGESDSENQEVLYGLIYKFLGRQLTKDNLFICDEGEREYTTLVSIFLDLPNVGRTKESI